MTYAQPQGLWNVKVSGFPVDFLPWPGPRFSVHSGCCEPVPWTEFWRLKSKVSVTVRPRDGTALFRAADGCRLPRPHTWPED